MTRATITTDASFSPKYKIGAYAFWIACNEKRYKKAGLLRGKILSSDDAEFRSIINGLATLGILNIARGQKVVINTDSQWVINFIDKGHKGKNLKPNLETYLKIVKENDFKIEFRKVLAHSGTETKATYVNDWCDKQAKQFLRNETKQIKWKEDAQNAGQI